MKIESIIQRENGTVVQFGSTTYHFKPEQQGGPHVAEVADADHAEILLNIADGYRSASGKTTKQTSSPESAASNGSNVLQGNDGAGTAGASTGASADQRAADDAVIVELLGKPIAKIKAALPGLTVEQIATAIAFEQAAEAPRKSLVDLLVAEGKHRAANQG